MTYIITQGCVDLLDRTCIEECPVDAIYFAGDLPGERLDFYRANIEFFARIGSPGGAARVGKIHADHPVVAALPPQAG